MPRHSPSTRSLRSESVLSLGSSSDDESVTHGDVDSMMRPLLKKQKKAVRRLERVERLVQKLINVPEHEIPALRKKVDSADVTAYEAKEAVDASTHALDAFKKEQKVADERTRAMVDEVSARMAAQEAQYHSLSSRVEQVERGQRALETKLSAIESIGAARAGYREQLTSGMSSQLTALRQETERARAELEARLAAAERRGEAQHEKLCSKLTAERDSIAGLEQQIASVAAAVRSELQAHATESGAASVEATAALAVMQAQVKQATETLQELQLAQPTLVRASAVEKVEARAEAIASELKSLVQRQVRGVRVVNVESRAGLRRGARMICHPSSGRGWALGKARGGGGVTMRVTVRAWAG